MRTRHLLTLALCALSTVACHRDSTNSGEDVAAAEEGAAMPSPTALGEPFALAIGQERAIAGTGLRLTFTRLESDSRCPRETRCITAGQARIGIHVYPEDVELVLTTLDQGEGVRHGGFVFRLLDLDPSPLVSDQAAPPSAYVAHLRVTAGD